MTICFIVCCCFCTAGLVRNLDGRPLRSENVYIDTGMAMQYDMSKSVFISGQFVNYYYQNNRYHGPYDMQLAFYPQTGYTVHGGGTDDVGTYIITGVYSPRTLRMGLKQHYQKGTGDPLKNLGHTVKIQVEWNSINGQFEGKYYLRTEKHRDENIFIIRFQYPKTTRPYTIESSV